MKEPTLGNPQNTIAVLQKYNFSFQKKFGQNFLIDTHVLDKIIRSAEITKEDMVVEIGPGIGTMTQYLALEGYENVQVINDDVLKVDIAKLAKEENGGRPIKVVANLPYYITTPIIMGLFENHVPLKSITVMVQKEVADRMQVGPGEIEKAIEGIGKSVSVRGEALTLEEFAALSNLLCESERMRTKE